MTKWSLVVGCWGLLGLSIACGGTDRNKPVGSGADGPALPPGNAGKNGQGGSQGEGGEDGMSVGGADPTSNSLDVEITYPTAASDPVADDVIVGSDVTVVCVVKAGASGEAPDVSTVTIEVFDAAGEPAVGFDEMPLAAAGVPTGETDEYSADFGLGAVASGPVSFRCSVSDSETAATSTATVETFVDHGPTITEKLPARDSSLQLEGLLHVEFTVAPTPLADDDSEAEVAGVKLYVAGIEIVDVVEDSASPGTYQAQVNFLDGELFKEPPSEHTSVRIEALNARSPEVALGVLNYPFVVDGQGPAITFTNPNPRAVFGDTEVEFTIADAGAGLDEDTLEIHISGHPDSPVPFDPNDSGRWTHQGNVFRFQFNTSILDDIEAQITVFVRASDAAGNPGESQSLLLVLDDVPPWIDLDPGNARGVDTQDVCSKSFDPVGPAALNDGQLVTVRNNRLRALIYDQTNFGSGMPLSYMAGTNPTSARLYLQEDPTQPFLVDTDGDGTCDNLAAENFPYVGLSAVPKAGSLTFVNNDHAVPPVISPDPEASNYCPTTSLTVLSTLCGDLSDMGVVVDHDSQTQGGEHIIYGIGNLPPAECTGSTWDLGLEVALDGWICLAVRASDQLKNVSVSRPLRICFDDPTVAGSPPCAGGGAPPSCTTDCTAPARFPASFYDF